MADLVGQQFGNYRLQRLLGEGGFAQVYLGEHIHLSSLAAIKVLRNRLDQDNQEDFRREARTIVRLKHPNIVRLLEFDIEGSTPFLVIDYAPGGTLRKRHPKGQPLALATILPFVRQVADALQYAHNEKLIHRDIKPENMLVGERGEVLLSDFGIATVAQSSRYQSTQEVAGTAAYMAPEQFQGKPRAASDQYSLGIVVYEWLTGTRPFHGSFLEISGQHLHLAPPPLHEHVPGISLALEQVVLTALEKDPQQRFASVQAFADALEQARQETALVSSLTQIVTPPHPDLGPTSIVPPAQRPLGVPVLAPSTAGSGSVGTPALATSPLAGTVSPLPPTFLRSVASPTVPPAKAPDRPHWHSIKPLAIVGSLLLILVVIAGSVTLLKLTPRLTFSPTSTLPPFQQAVVTGSHITDIQVGSGFDSSTQTIQGEKSIFRVGEKVFVVCRLSTTDYTANLTYTLLQGHQSVLSKTINDSVGGIPYNPSSHSISGMNSFDTTITAPGNYQWMIAYNGTPEASITFLVV